MDGGVLALSNNKKRSVSDIPIFIDERLWNELYTLVNLQGWPYKTNRDEYQLRDRALISLLILTGLRISEALQLAKTQFRIYDNYILLLNVKTLKKNKLRRRIILPKEGHFSPFTEIFEKWLSMVPKDDAYVFPRGSVKGFVWRTRLSRKRAFWIIKSMTHRFPHWFRAVCETVYGRIVFRRDAWKLKEFMGYNRLDSTSPYIGGSWEEDEDKIFKL